MKSFFHLRESSILETKSAPKGFHFTKDGKLKRGDADVDGPGGPKLRSDPLDKQRSKVPPVSEASGESYLKHRVSVTVSDPQHTMASKRGEKIEKRIRLLAKSDSDAVTLAKHHFKKQGYKVHDANYIGITESEVIVTPKKMVGEPEKGTYAYERKYGKFTAKGELRKKPNPNKPPMKESVDDEGAMAKGQLMQMVSQASMLARMMDDNKQLDGWVQSKLTMAADYLDSVHDYLMHNEQDVDQMEESVKTTHEDPLVTVHNKHEGKWELHTHANLSTANNIFRTNVKHSDVHKGPVEVKSGGSYGNVKFTISKHHETAMKEEVNLEEGADAQKRFQEYHNDAAKMLKGIHKKLSEHYSMNHKNAHWGHVGDIRHVHDQLREIHDRLHEQGEYAKEAKM